MSEQPEIQPPDCAATGPENSGPPAPGSFAAGYHEGQEDVLYAVAAGHQWALDKLELHKTKAAKIAALNAQITQERERLAGTVKPLKVTRVIRMAPGVCHYCDQHPEGTMMPPHGASSRCESGKRPHCTCDVCF